MKGFFVTAIGTDCGKTIASAILTEALQANYWKPIQAGLPDDTTRVKSLVSNGTSCFHEELYRLRAPMSPHAAAELDAVKIELAKFKLPETNNQLIVEGAGGILVPINDRETVADLIIHLKLPIILVINFYLGSINHSLLTLEAIERRKLKLAGLIFNGIQTPTSKSVILRKTTAPVLLEIAQENKLNQHVISNYAATLLKKMQDEGLA